MADDNPRSFHTLDLKESDILDTTPFSGERDETGTRGQYGAHVAAAGVGGHSDDSDASESDAAAEGALLYPGGAAAGGSAPLPWGARKERTCFPSSVQIDPDLRPGEFVMRTQFAEFTLQAERKIEVVMLEPLERPLSKSLQRGEDAQFDQLLTTFGSVAEHCLPSLLRTLFAWYDRQGLDACLEPSASLRSDKSLRLEPPPDRQELELREDRRDLAVEFVFCLALIEVLRQLHLHPGHEDLIRHLENMAFRHFKYRESTSAGPNATNVNLIADLYAEVIGVLAQSRFQSVRTRFMHELRDLNAKESSQQTAQGTIALLMGMKFFRVKMVPIEEFEASFQFMQELSKYFLEVKDKDIKHALAGLFVEILVPVAACVKNEVNVPCLKAFVEMLYTHTLDMCTKGKHRLAIFPLVTCLLCVSQKQFFLSNWHYFLAMCLSNLKNKDYKMARVALESLYRLLWVYMVRIKCESNTATQSRLQSIVNSLFPKGSKNVVPRDTPFNIFVKIIQFIAHERLDFAMREIVFDLLSVGRPIKIVTTPERMAIGLRSFLVVADGLQQKEGQPPMPRTVAVLPSGNTLRVKKTFLSTMLTDDTARSIGISAYYPYVRKVFSDILRALDSQLGRPLMMTSTQNVNKEPDEIFTGERKPKIELFRTCVAAIPRLIPDGLTRQDLIDMLARLTVHVDQDLRLQSFQGLQNLVLDFPEWRGDVVFGLVSFMSREVADTTQQLLDNGLRVLLQLLTTWRNAIGTPSCSATLKQRELNDVSASYSHHVDLPAVLHMVEGFTLVMLCNYRLSTRRLSVHILKEVKLLFKALDCLSSSEMTVIDAMDSACPSVVDRCLSILPSGEKAAVLSTCSVDLQWIAERNSAVWTAGVYDDGARSASLPYLAGADAWRICLTGFLERQHLPSRCACSVAHSWPVVHHRINSLFSVVDPTPVSDNRASLLRATTAAKRPTDQRDTYMGLWRNYALFACRVVPAVSAPLAVRCTSPEMLNMSVSTETGGGDRGGGSDPASLHRLLVPLLRCEGCQELRDGVTEALGRVNHLALKDLMLELVVYIREAIDRKQENMRRRRRRDALRLQLISVFEMIADQGTFGLCSGMVDSDTQSLYPMFVEYIDGARLFLESESDKEAAAVQTIKLKFCWFVRKLIKSFPLDARVTLLKRDLRASLFQLFASWSGALGRPFGSGAVALGGGAPTATDALSELELAAVHAAWTVLCCGPVVDPAALHDEAGVVYAGLELLLSRTEPRLHQLARETTVLLLEFNADVSALLDWVVERCYTGGSWVADSCFHAIATVFCAKEYPCDHYTAVINVTLLSTGCPRVEVHETAFQLLQLLDKRFFSREGRHHLSADNETDAEKQRREHSTLDSRLATGFSRSQMFLSRQLAQLHPELTMPMFSEITSRLQLARPVARQMMLQYLLPWLHNMELVDPNVQPMSPLAKIQYFSHQTSPRFGGVSCGGPQQQHRLEAWGSAEATEMVLNNLLYITAKIGDEHPIEVEQLWAALCSCWPNNLKIILRYLFILCGMAPSELLPFGRRVVVYLARARPDQLVDEMIRELQTVESNSYTVERTETPPFYRLTALRKASNHSVMDVSGTGTSEQVMSGAGGGALLVEKGTIHTKRHSGEELFQDIVGAARVVSHSGPASIRSSSTVSSGRSQDRSRVLPEDAAVRSQSAIMDNFTLMRTQAESRQQCSPLPSSPLMDKIDTPQPHPLPMPEYGGYFAPLSTYLPHCSQPIANFHRCNLAMMLIQDVLLDGPEAPSAVWPVHVPLMLHVILLGMDHNRSVVHESSKRLLLNLLVVLSRHGDHLSVARALISCRTELLEYGIAVPPPSISRMQLTDEPRSFDAQPDAAASGVSLMRSFVSPAVTTASSDSQEGSTPTTQVPTIVTGDDSEPASLVSVATENSPGMSLPQLCLTLVDYLASRRCVPLWSHEDITAREWNIPSVAQLSQFVDHLVRVFSESLPQVRVPERWAQLALHIALSCSSRHLAGRSLQVFRALCVPITGRMLADILSRLVETVSEQGEDMHGYVTEIMLTLESAVDCVDSDFRPIDFVKELFKSTPNLMNKEPRRPLVTGSVGPTCGSQLAGHLRSTTSYSMSAQGGGPGVRRRCGAGDRDPRGRDAAAGVADAAAGAAALGRSRSANSLKNMSSADPDSEESKLSVLVQLFWLSVSLLESDYEYEYLLAMRLLEKVMSKLSLDRPDCRDKIDKIQLQLHWSSFPGVHALLLKGCTNPATYEPAIALISRFTPLLDVAVVDPSLSMGFPMNVMALLPYMVYHYEDADPFCVRTAENIAQACMERSKKLENLATVMTLYSRRTFSKESLQWTKCVVKYLTDTYGHMSVGMMVFLVEVLEKGPAFVQQPILNVLHCLLHYMDAAGSGSLTQLVNTDLLRAMALCAQQPGQPHWREALRILKLAVTQSSTLSMAPAVGGSAARAAAADTRIHVSFAETEPSAGKKELPGRTMEFTFNVSQTPIIGRRLPVEEPVDDVADESGTGSAAVDGVLPRRFASGGGGSDVAVSGWKRPWLSQIRTRDRLVSLLVSCGTRVGLPKSPSVIFSQNSDALERQSSMASSTEEVSGGQQVAAGAHASVESLDDHEAQQFGVIREFDFLEYELESQEGESMDNFNWGVRRRSLTSLDADGAVSLPEPELSLLSSERASPVHLSQTNTSSSAAGQRDESSEEDEDGGSVSPLEEMTTSADMTADSVLESHEHRALSDSSSQSSCSSSTNGEPVNSNELTPCNASLSLSATLLQLADGTLPRPMAEDEDDASPRHTDLEQEWFSRVSSLMTTEEDVDSSSQAAGAMLLFCRLLADIQRGFLLTVDDECVQLVAAPCRPALSGVLHTLQQLQLPHVYVSGAALRVLGVLPRLRFSLLELHEHLLTYQQRRELTLRCLHTARCTLTLQHDDGDAADVTHSTTHQLFRSLYKLHFQLLLLVDGWAKTLSYIAVDATGLVDLTSEVTQLRHALMAAALLHQDADMPPPGHEHSSSRHQAEQSLTRLLGEELCVQALHEFRRQRHLFSPQQIHEGDEVASVLDIYCQQRSESGHLPVVSLGATTQLCTTCASLQQANVMLLAALRQHERQMSITKRAADSHPPSADC